MTNTIRTVRNEFSKKHPYLVVRLPPPISSYTPGAASSGLFCLDDGGGGNGDGGGGSGDGGGGGDDGE